MKLFWEFFKISFENYLCMMIMIVIMLDALVKWFTENTTIRLVLARTIGNDFHFEKPSNLYEVELSLPKI